MTREDLTWALLNAWTDARHNGGWGDIADYILDLLAKERAAALAEVDENEIMQFQREYMGSYLNPLLRFERALNHFLANRRTIMPSAPMFSADFERSG